MVNKCEVNNINDLLAAVKLAEEYFKHVSILWRGHGKANWDLIPRLYRKKYSVPIIEYEHSINLEFRRRAKTRHSNCPPDESDEAWLFLMQHYGHSTRLLDWTESILIATYFAVSENKYADEQGALWALDPFGLNQHQVRLPGIPDPSHDQVKSLFNTAFAGTLKKKEHVIVAVNTEEVDIRMLAQMAGFTVHGTKTPLNKIPNNRIFLLKFQIPSKARKRLKDSLWTLCIRESNLFPDLEHLAKDIVEKEFYEPYS